MIASATDFHCGSRRGLTPQPWSILDSACQPRKPWAGLAQVCECPLLAQSGHWPMTGASSERGHIKKKAI